MKPQPGWKCTKCNRYFTILQEAVKCHNGNVVSFMKCGICGNRWKEENEAIDCCDPSKKKRSLTERLSGVLKD